MSRSTIGWYAILVLLAGTIGVVSLLNPLAGWFPGQARKSSVPPVVGVGGIVFPLAVVAFIAEATKSSRRATPGRTRALEVPWLRCPSARRILRPLAPDGLLALRWVAGSRPGLARSAPVSVTRFRPDMTRMRSSQSCRTRTASQKRRSARSIPCWPRSLPALVV